MSPFILRRTKEKVLKELPERTEIIHKFEFEPEEKAFYEALRLRSIEVLSGSDENTGKPESQLQIFAQLMKLRRACCHPQMVLPTINLESTKVEVFTEMVTALIGEGHKILVFCQFVDFLKILKSRLEELEITYQYLDGSTSPKQRKERVDLFQSGSGDVFLISLRAGGLGLNLTAADYVIHMDTWWNPAVEDQGSDRSHRIVQKRPVTIYKMIAKHTIEEKIMELHKDKRSIADSLLEGTDISAKLTPEELLALIKN